MKTRPMGTEFSMQTVGSDGQKDMTKLRVALRSCKPTPETVFLRRINRLFFLLEASCVLLEVRN